MKQQTAEKTSLIADQIREKAEQAARLVRDNTPDSVRDKTAQAAAQVWGGATRAGQYGGGHDPRPAAGEGRPSHGGRTRQPHSAPGRRRRDHRPRAGASQPRKSPLRPTTLRGRTRRLRRRAAWSRGSRPTSPGRSVKARMTLWTPLRRPHEKADPARRCDPGHGLRRGQGLGRPIGRGCSTSPDRGLAGQTHPDRPASAAFNGSGPCTHGRGRRHLAAPAWAVPEAADQEDDQNHSGEDEE